MMHTRLNRFSLIAPLVLSTLAFMLVMANILAGVAPQPDENASAHIFQLLIVGQIPLMVLFLLSADWRTWWPPTLLAAQLAAICVAMLPVWLAGY
jgi:hypothetical protein